MSIFGEGGGAGGGGLNGELPGGMNCAKAPDAHSANTTRQTYLTYLKFRFMPCMS